jgi:hypothetical protein
MERHVLQNPPVQSFRAACTELRAGLSEATEIVEENHGSGFPQTLNRLSGADETA